MTALEVANRLVWRLANECRDDDVLIVGVATPIAAAAGLLARELLSPDLTVLIGASVAPSTHDIARAMLEADFVARHAAGSFGQAEVLDLLQRGAVTLQFISPAQVDRRGRVNSSAVRRRDGTVMRLPGPLALPDVCGLVGRLVGYRAAHSSRLLVDEVDVVTGIGSADRSLRSAAGLTGQGLVRLITDLAVLQFHPQTASVSVESVAPGVPVADLLAGCGFPLAVPPELSVEAPPPQEALDLLDRVIDPHRMRGLEVPSARVAARARLDVLAR